MPQYPTFDLLRRAHQPAIEACTRAYPPYSDFSFVSLWCWNGDQQLAVCTLHGNLVVRFRDYFSEVPLLSFIGNRKVGETIETLLADDSHADPRTARLAYVPAELLAEADLPGDLELVEDRDNFDYVYSTESLSQMKGSAYQVPRNFVNRFTKRYSWQARVLDLSLGDNWDAALGVQRRWADAKARRGMSVSVDIAAFARLRELLGHVPLVALGLAVDGVLRGYTVNERHDGGYATNLFEHGDVDYVGIFPALKRSTAQHLAATGTAWWNHQQDSGFAGLRRSKESFRPCRYMKKVTIRRRDPTSDPPPA